MNQTQMSLVQLLKNRGKQTKRNRRLRPTTPSKRSEVWFRHQLESYIKQLNEEIKEALNSVSLRFNDSVTVNDKPVILNAMLKAIQKLMEKRAKQDAMNMINHLAAEFAKRANQQNHAQTVSALKNALGVDVSQFIMKNPEITATIESAMIENINLIKSIAEEHLRKVQRVVKEKMTAGERHESIISEISRIGEVSKSRAKLIARDQANKLNGSLTQVRQTSLGISKYEWSTSADERVREDHKANNGKVFDWNNPPATGHPGQDIQCRCVAIPIFESE